MSIARCYTTIDVVYENNNICMEFWKLWFIFEPDKRIACQ